MATPRGLIALYDQSRAIGCMLAGLAAAETASPGQCLKNDRLPATRERHFKLAGPNIGRWTEKFHYAFFVDPFTFRLDVMHHDLRFVLLLERRCLGWQVVRLSVPFGEIGRKRGGGKG